jgi:hypothetical protein
MVDTVNPAESVADNSSSSRVKLGTETNGYEERTASAPDAPDPEPGCTICRDPIWPLHPAQLELGVKARLYGAWVDIILVMLPLCFLGSWMTAILSRSLGVHLSKTSCTDIAARYIECMMDSDDTYI